MLFDIVCNGAGGAPYAGHMAGEAGIREQLRAMAMVLTGVRGRLGALSAGLPDEEPELEGEESPGLRSIISCVITDSIDPAIRDLLRAADQETSPIEAAAAAPDLHTVRDEYGALWSRLDADLPRLLAAQQAEHREAETLFLQLTACDGGERSAAIEDARFHRLIVVDRLLEGAQAMLPADPAAAEELAALAATLAERLTLADESTAGRARAGCWIGHARRIAGDPAGAEQALSAATLYARWDGEQALLCRALSLLRWEQGRFDEAAALLERAAELAAGEELPHEEGACWVLRALLAVEEGKIGDAVGMLRTGLPLLTDAWLTLYGGLALALGLAERGLETRARAQRDESLRLLITSPAPAYLFALRQSADIASSLGEHERADEMLEELRSAALRGGWLPEAALATLDLARLDAELGRSREAAEVRAAALETTFPASDDLTALLAALRRYPPRPLPCGETLPAYTAALKVTFLRRLRLRGARSAPLPFS